MKFTVSVKQQYVHEKQIMENLRMLADDVLEKDDVYVFISNTGFDSLSTYLRQLRVVHKLETKTKL